MSSKLSSLIEVREAVVTAWEMVMWSRRREMMKIARAIVDSWNTVKSAFRTCLQSTTVGAAQHVSVLIGNALAQERGSPKGIRLVKPITLQPSLTPY